MKKFIILTTLLCLLSLSGCGAANAEPAPTPAPTPLPTPAPTPIPTPAIVFLWGESYPAELSELDLRNKSGSAEELLAALSTFEKLESVDLRGIPLTAEQMLSLREALPDTLFLWELEIHGVTVSSLDEFLSLDGIPMEDVSAVEAALPLFPALKQIDMCGCGIDDESMYAFDKRWPDTRIVWLSQIGGLPMRTDSVFFLRNADGVDPMAVTSANLDVQLKYFPDLIALDLGHSESLVTDCSFLRHTPKLQILILAECAITDISPIAQLEELVYLELFLNWYLEDLSPLAGHEKLLDLNIAYTAVTDLSPLYDCPSLERLWLNGCRRLGSGAKEEFLAQKPDCLYYHVIHANSTSGGWRQHERYYWVWDTLHPDWKYPVPEKE